MAKVSLHPDITNFMREQGFHDTHTEDILANNQPVLFFQFDEPYQKHVIVKEETKGLRITCRTWNDEPEAERWGVSLESVIYAPSLEQWMHLMHAGGMVAIEESILQPNSL